MKIILILVILITSLMMYQNYQQRLIIDDLYQIVESHNQSLKMLWEMEW